ncbi:Protein DMP2 [Camellia lanceoleosa]|uniref:Protein DMP2 n=1 Tax=Camellia lanceoleosa TaxID=1840588 RepID=A0ACC0HDA6_9ERIC|nr:Protein DMP2 [Camellia lanceoleosa]
MADIKTTSSSSSTTQNITDKTYATAGNLIKLLPTGTVFFFQFFNPVFTNNGTCHVANKYLTAFLIGVCGISCFMSTFHDSYKGSDKNTHYGIATLKGIWPSTASDGVDLSVLRLRPGDFVHAFFALIVFAVVSLLDANTVNCFYPSFISSQKVLVMVLPPLVGAVAGFVSMVFPYTRHGIGYPSTQSSTTQSSTSS